MWSVKDSGSTSNLGTYYPGNQFVNVIAIDPWVSGFPTTAWYQAIQSMAAADGKPTALAEVGALPTPSQLASQPKWTYFNDWAGFITSSNTNAQIQATYFDAPVLHQGQIHLPGSTPAGPITGYQGLCLDDRASSTANLNPIQVYTCNGTAAQQWTVGANNTLTVLGKCLDVQSGGTVNGTTVDEFDCNGTSAQVWQPQSNGALLNPQSGRCLDDTGWSTTPGTQAQIWDCTGNANQQWHLP